jgi:hypothetical protein
MTSENWKQWPKPLRTRYTPKITKLSSKTNEALYIEENETPFKNEYLCQISQRNLVTEAKPRRLPSLENRP